MSLEIKCSACGDELEEPGALLFGPPLEGYTTKRHLCQECFEKIRATISSIKQWAESVRKYGAPDPTVEWPPK